MSDFEMVIFTCGIVLLIWSGIGEFRKWSRRKLAKQKCRDSLTFRLVESKIGHRAELID